MSAGYEPFGREPPICEALCNARATHMKNLLLAAALAIFALGVVAVSVIAHTDFASTEFSSVEAAGGAAK